MNKLPKIMTQDLSFEKMKSANILCLGNDIMLLEGLETEFAFPPYFRTEDPMILILTHGSISGRLNLKEIEIVAPALVLIIPEQILEFLSASDDCDGVVLQYSSNFYTQIGLSSNYQLRSTLSGQVKIQLETESLEAVMLYVHMLKKLMRQTDNPYLLLSAVNLTRAFFYGLGYYLHKSLKERQLSQNEQLVNDFTVAVAKHCKKERLIDYYADLLHVTPKHLMNTVRNVTGRTAGKWIEQLVILEAKSLLYNSFLTISQVSDMLSFPDQSTFCKYFKRIVGISPKEFRTTGRV